MDQSFNFANFAGANSLISTVNAANLEGNILRVCPNRTNNQGQAWYGNQVQVLGFTTTFQFSLNGGAGMFTSHSGFGTQCNIGEGFAFVIQTDNILASAGIGPGLGYGDSGSGPAGISNSVAIEFDTVQVTPCYLCY